MPSDTDSKIMTGAGFGHSWAEMKAYVAQEIAKVPTAPQQILPIPVLTEGEDANGYTQFGYENNFAGYGEGITVRYADGAAPTLENPEIEPDKTTVYNSGDYHIRAVPPAGSNLLPSPEILKTVEFNPTGWISSGQIGSFIPERIRYVNGYFIITGGPSGRILFSTDAVSWTQSEALPSITAESDDVVYGNGKYVMQLSSSFVAYSTDLINWTPVEIYTTNLYEITFCNGMFVVIARTDTWTSSDGISWTKHEDVLENDVPRDVCVAFDKIVLARDDGLYASADGITWERVVITGAVSLAYDELNDYLYSVNEGTYVRRYNAQFQEEDFFYNSSCQFDGLAIGKKYMAIIDNPNRGFHYAPIGSNEIVLAEYTFNGSWICYGENMFVASYYAGSISTPQTVAIRCYE